MRSLKSIVRARGAPDYANRACEISMGEAAKVEKLFFFNFVALIRDEKEIIGIDCEKIGKIC